MKVNCKSFSEDELKVIMYQLTISGLVDLTVEDFTVVTKKVQPWYELYQLKSELKIKPYSEDGVGGDRHEESSTMIWAISTEKWIKN